MLLAILIRRLEIVQFLIEIRQFRLEIRRLLDLSRRDVGCRCQDEPEKSMSDHQYRTWPFESRRYKDMERYKDLKETYIFPTPS
jgi:hypothetical protein